MAIYFVLVFAIFIMYVVLCKNSHKKYYSIFLFASLLILFAVSTFRSASMGADYQGYVSDFFSIRKGGKSYYEAGYVLLNRLIGKFTDKYYGLACGINLLLFVPFFIYIKKYVKNNYWHWCVFVFLLNPYLFIQSSFNALRQSCATGIILLALCFLNGINVKNFYKIVGYCLFVIIAAQFHSVAYSFLLLPLLFLPNFNKKTILIIACVCLGLNIIGFADLLYTVASLWGYSRYVQYTASLLDNPFFVGFVFIVLLFLLGHYNELTECKEEKRFVDFYLLSLCFLLVAVTNDMLFRVYIMIEFMVLPGLTIILSKSFNKAERLRLQNGNKIVKFFYGAFYLCFFSGYILYLGVTGNVHYIPFSFCF